MSASMSAAADALSPACSSKMADEAGEGSAHVQMMQTLKHARNHMQMSIAIRSLVSA